MTHLKVLLRRPLPYALAVADTPVWRRGSAAMWPSRAGAARLWRIGLGMAVVLLSAGAVLYPLSQAGGSLARGRGYVATVDPAAGVVTYQTGTATFTLEMSEVPQIYRNGRSAIIQDLRVGDHVLVKYDSVWRRTVLEVHAVGRRP